METTEEICDWIESLANWKTFFTGTVAPRRYLRRDGIIDYHHISRKSLEKAFKSFMKKHFPGVSYVVAYEPFKDGVGWHLHALLADAYGMRYKNGTLFTKWLERFGRNSTEGIEHPANVRNYVTKYLTKEWTQNETTFPDYRQGINHLNEIWWEVKIAKQPEFPTA